MKVWPPNPGLTDMISTWRTIERTGSNITTGVPGLRVTLGVAPASSIDRSVR